MSSFAREKTLENSGPSGAEGGRAMAWWGWLLVGIAVLAVLVGVFGGGEDSGDSDMP